ncbi:MAG: pyruvate, phosphate dikinase [Acidobacteriia bacterium]|nr:pyruvate, phosphate dikinase [Terriglobia bacterium]
MEKFVYFFGDGKADGNGQMKDLLGGKGAGLAEMTNVGLPVPPGFTISTSACRLFYENGGRLPEAVVSEVNAAIQQLQSTVGKKFGSAEKPLLVSVRSGAKFSMPGMMDTVLNLGLNEKTVETMAQLTSNERFAYDAYRRFIQMFGKIVLAVDPIQFEQTFDHAKKSNKAKLDTDLDARALKEVCKEFKNIIKLSTGEEFPADPMKQLDLAVKAVFSSWNGKRAIDYRRLNKIPDDLGTAVNIVTMVFGNMGLTSGTGVAFTRNPATGDNELYGEYLPNAQGEDVVAGVRTAKPIRQLKDEMPPVYEEFSTLARQLEKHYKDVQDIEFTIENGKLWMLQTRNAKRTGPAAVKIAVDMAHEGMIDEQTALMRVEPSQLDQLLHPMVDPKEKITVIATGLPASPGAASGKVVFDPDLAEKEASKGEKVILVRIETSPEDFHGMVAAQAILTARGGMTSHAAVVARGMGKCCVAGCAELEINYDKKFFKTNNQTIKQGDWITLDGTAGQVILGRPRLMDPQPELNESFVKLMNWADKTRTMKVRTNADTPKDATVARKFGAEGIGLCRTEHMFFEGDRIDAVRQMIVGAADYKRFELQIQRIEGELVKVTSQQKIKELKRELVTLKKQIKTPKALYFGAIKKLLPMQRQDFVGIFRAMDGLPVTIRTLDPPLHEFLPHTEADIRKLAKKLKYPAKDLMVKFAALHEVNPMLGHRGCRLGIVYPELTEMQARAIFEAAAQVQKEGVKVIPEVMIPLVGHINELKLQETSVRKVAEDVKSRLKVSLEYLVGTMIELPRAALTAGEIATVAEFFSFGTNDLTQMTYGLSRDDAGKFLPFYIDNGILKEDPFQTLDQEGVGQLISWAVERGRLTRPQLKIGICGEHGGDPQSVEFCFRNRLNYVSCSPYRVPIARLAAAQATIQDKTESARTV